MLLEATDYGGMEIWKRSTAALRAAQQHVAIASKLQNMAVWEQSTAVCSLCAAAYATACQKKGGGAQHVAHVQLDVPPRLTLCEPSRHIFLCRLGSHKPKLHELAHAGSWRLQVDLHGAFSFGSSYSPSSCAPSLSQVMF